MPEVAPAPTCTLHAVLPALMLGLLNAAVFEPGFQAWDVCVALKDQGLLAKQTHGNIIRFAPPLTISRKEIDHALAIIQRVFEAVA